MTAVELWIDPICPWAWMTSRWLIEVERVRGVEVTWSVMSLSMLNEGRDLSPNYREMLDRSWGPSRILTAAAREHGPQMVKPLYDAMGTRFHPGGNSDRPQVIAEALAEVGLPAQFASYADDPSVDPDLRASMDRALQLVGDQVGTPIIAVGGVAFFGPVVSPAPKGEEAGKLWDGCVLVAGTSGFFELKRSRNVDPIFD